MDIDGVTALVAGGASGLGAAAARMLAEADADVAILDRDGEGAAEVAARCLGYSQQCDVADAEHVAVGISSAMARFGQAPRIVVNCAGIGLRAPLVGREGRTALPLLRRTVEVNLIGACNVMSYAAQAMIDLPPTDAGERGVIVNVADAAGPDGPPGQAALAASAAGIVALTLPAARELAAHAIRVVTIVTGAFDTAAMADLPRAAREAVADAVPFPKRLGRPDEFARLVREVVENGYINGSVIRLDGGLRLSGD